MPPKKLSAPYRCRAPLFSSDTFYDAEAIPPRQLEPLGVLAVEMEAAALYLNAARRGQKRASALLHHFRQSRQPAKGSLRWSARCALRS